MQFRDLKKQYQVLKPQIDQAVTRVMSDANFISGSQVSALEERLAKYVGVKHCISCGNGTDALKLAEMALGIGPGDAVFVPDFTFFSSAETVADLGATPVFVDVCRETFNINPASLEREIESTAAQGSLKPKAVVAVDLFGQPANYPELRKICNKYGLTLIEDGAQGFGGRINDKVACSFGDISTTSFFPAKPLGCYGDGGAIFTDDDEIADLILSLRVHGKSPEDKYNNLRLGMNSRLDTIQAAVLDVKLTAFEDYELEAVNKAAQMYDQRLAGKLRTPAVPQGFYSSWAQYTLRLDSREQRDALQAALKAKGIPTMVYYPRGMHQQGAFSHLPYNGQCPVSEELCSCVLSLPMHPYLTEEDVDFVSSAVLENL